MKLVSALTASATLCVAFLGGCASIVNGQNQSISVEARTDRAIAAEMTLNTSTVDRVQDKWLKNLLAFNDRLIHARSSYNVIRLNSQEFL